MKRLMNRHPGAGAQMLLGLLPVFVLLFAYLLGSNARLQENPHDKLMPSASTLMESVKRMAFEPSKRSGDYLLWSDTGASLKRLAIGVAASAAIALFFGVINGLLPVARASFSPLVTVISLVPPMAILPILFIIFGLGEVSKVVLIGIGITPFLIRDLQTRVREIPQELLVKAQTLGANTWQIVLRVVLPQVLPRLIEAVRLSLGPAWLFLIAAEAIASQEGLGYRIFLVRRYLAMDVILPYVVWITLLAYCMDWLLATASRKLFPWYHGIGTQNGPLGNTTA
jgi:NitT/TauT family transport system permease protein